MQLIVSIRIIFLFYTTSISTKVTFIQHNNQNKSSEFKLEIQTIKTLCTTFINSKYNFHHRKTFVLIKSTVSTRLHPASTHADCNCNHNF